MIVHVLGYLGLIPFVASPFFLLMDESVFVFSPERLFLTYSAVILTFMSGALWGRCVADSQSRHSLSFLLSNVFTLLAWVVMLLGHAFYYFGLTLCCLGFAMIWVLERRLGGNSSEIQGYWVLRTRLTFVVVVMHCVMLGLLAG